MSSYDNDELHEILLCLTCSFYFNSSSSSSHLHKMLTAPFRNNLRVQLTPASSRWFSAARKLEGKVALITGAASGIGRETAAKFLSNGAKVVVADIQTGPDREPDPNAAYITCDVTKESDVSSAVDFTISKFGQLDIMYNNAGIACHTPPSIADLDLASFDRVMAVNVRGVIAGIKHGARVMIPRRKGVILCTASVTGLMGGLAQVTYSVSKSCVIGAVRAAASELCGHGIRINCVSPMAIPTPFVMEEIRKYYPMVEEEKLVKMVEGVSVLRGASCEAGDVAEAALFLASDEAKFVSGHNLVVDGGFTSFKNLTLPTIDQL